MNIDEEFSTLSVVSSQDPEQAMTGILSEDHGALPTVNVADHFPDSHQIWDKLTLWFKLRSIAQPYHVRGIINTRLPLLDASKKNLADKYLTRAMIILTGFMHYYIYDDYRHTGQRPTFENLPKQIRYPLQQVAKRLGLVARFAKINDSKKAYSRHYLYDFLLNYFLVDKDADISLSNLELIFTYFNIPEEYQITLVVGPLVEKAFSPAITQMVKLSQSVKALEKKEKEEKELLKAIQLALEKINHSISAVQEVLKLLYPYSKKNGRQMDPVLFAQTFVQTGAATFQGGIGNNGGDAILFKLLDHLIVRKYAKEQVGQTAIARYAYLPTAVRTLCEALDKMNFPGWIKEYTQGLERDTDIILAWQALEKSYETMLRTHLAFAYLYFRIFLFSSDPSDKPAEGFARGLSNAIANRFKEDYQDEEEKKLAVRDDCESVQHASTKRVKGKDTDNTTLREQYELQGRFLELPTSSITNVYTPMQLASHHLPNDPWVALPGGHIISLETCFPTNKTNKKNKWIHPGGYKIFLTFLGQLIPGNVLTLGHPGGSYFLCQQKASCPQQIKGQLDIYDHLNTNENYQQWLKLYHCIINMKHWLMIYCSQETMQRGFYFSDNVLVRYIEVCYLPMLKQFIRVYDQYHELKPETTLLASLRESIREEQPKTLLALTQLQALRDQIKQNIAQMTVFSTYSLSAEYEKATYLQRLAWQICAYFAKLYIKYVLLLSSLIYTAHVQIFFDFVKQIELPILCGGYHLEEHKQPKQSLLTLQLEKVLTQLKSFQQVKSTNSLRLLYLLLLYSKWSCCLLVSVSTFALLSSIQFIFTHCFAKQSQINTAWLTLACCGFSYVGYHYMMNEKESKAPHVQVGLGMSVTC